MNGKKLFAAGETYTDDQIRENRLHFGLVFQNFNLFPQYNVLQNVTLAPTLLKMGTPEELAEQGKKLLDGNVTVMVEDISKITEIVE